MLADSSINIGFKLFFIFEFHFCFILFAISYWRCAFNDPGYVDEQIVIHFIYSLSNFYI